MAKKTKVTLEAAAHIYSEIWGFEVSPAELKSQGVHHPLGQYFWSKDEIDVESFKHALDETLAKQGRNRARNDAKSAAMLKKVDQTSEYLQSRLEDWYNR